MNKPRDILRTRFHHIGWWIALVLVLAFVPSVLSAGVLPPIKENQMLDGASETGVRLAVAHYLAARGWEGTEPEYPDLLGYLSAHVRMEDGRGVWQKKYYDFAGENLEKLHRIRQALDNQPPAYRGEWLRWFSSRLIGYRIPYDVDHWVETLGALPEGEVRRMADLEAFEKEIHERYGFEKRPPGERAWIAAGLAGVNPGLEPEGGVAEGVEAETSRWRVEWNGWESAHRLRSGAHLLFPSLEWLLSRERYAPDAPAHETVSTTPRHLHLRLPGAGPEKKDFLLRLDLEDDRVVGAMVRSTRNPHRILPVIPLEVRADGTPAGIPPEPTPAPKREARLDTIDLTAPLGGPLDLLPPDPTPDPEAKPTPEPPRRFLRPWLRLEDGGLRGCARFFQTSPRGSEYVLELEFDVALDDGGPRGQVWTRHPASIRRPGDDVEISGPTPVLPGAALPAGNKPRGAWTTPWGNDASALADVRPPVTGDPSRARLAWVSGHTIPTGRGPNTRGASRPQPPGLPLSGGWGSPVLSDGTVVLSYFEPSGPQYAYGATPREDPLANQALDMMRVGADEVLHAFDGATGATRWKLRMPGRGINWMGFNKGGPGSSAGVGDGVAVWLGTTGEVYAADLESGNLLWMNHIGLRHELMRETLRVYRKEGHLFTTRNDFQSAVLVLDGVAVVSDHAFTKYGYRYERECGLVGFDLHTGRRLWHRPGVAGKNVNNQGGQRWRHGERDLILTGNSGGTFLLEPRTGEVLAHAPGLRNRDWGLVAGEGVVAGEVVEDAENDDKSYRIGAYRLDPENGFSLLWTLPEAYERRAGSGVYQNGRFYFSVGGEAEGLVCVEAETGEVLARETSRLGGGEHAPFIVSLGDMLVGALDRTRGLVLFDPDPGRLEGSAHVWPLRLATGYCGSLVPVAADGRLFIRGPERLLCFDLGRRP